MKRILATLVIAGLVAGCAAQGGNLRTVEGGRLNLLILGEDAGADAPPRSGRVFKRVRDALTGEMLDAGFNVYDEAAAMPGAAGRSDAEIFAVARSVKPVPIDATVIFTVHVASDERAQARKLRVRLAGRLLNIASGRRLGNYETESPTWIAIPANCDRDCELEWIGVEASLLARDLGATLAKRLD